MSVRAKAQAPERCRVSVANAQLAGEPLDLTTVSAVSLEIKRPNGSEVVWNTTILVQTVELLVVEHVFARNDVYQPGDYGIQMALTVPGGVRRAGPGNLQVLP